MRLPAPSPLAPVLAVALLAFAGAAAVEATVGQHYVDRVTMVIAAPSGDAGDETSEAPSAEALSPAHEQARTLARRGRVDEALVQLDALLAEVPDHGPLRAEVGFWLLAEGDTARARAELERAAAAAPDNAWIHLTLGRARSTDGDLEGAQAAYERALALHPAYTTARVSLGVVLRKRGELDASIALLEEAAETGSNEEEARALVALGRSYLAAGRVPAAVEALEQAILHAPADIDVRLGAARAWLFEAPPELRGRAVAVLDETARMAPDVAEVHSARGRALEMTGDAVGAREAYRTALTLDPHYAYVQRRLIRLALEEGDLDVARAQAAQLVEVNPEEAEHHVLAGLVAVAAERPSDARAAYEEAIRRAGGSYPEASYNLGLLERSQGHPGAAVRAYRDALAARPDYPEASNNLGLALVDTGAVAEAEATWRGLVAVHHDHVGAWLNLGGLFADDGRLDEAITAYEAALSVRPDYRKALLNLGVAYGRAGQPERAIATYQQLVSLHPEYSKGWYNLGLALKREGRDDEARAALERAVAQAPESQAPRASLARLVRDMGDLDAARTQFTELVDRTPGDASLRLGLARTLWALEDGAGCRRHAKAALAVEPDSPAATRLLQQCSES